MARRTYIRGIMDRWTKERHDKLIFQLDNDAKHPIPAEIRAEMLRALTEVELLRGTLGRIKRMIVLFLKRPEFFDTL